VKLRWNAAIFVAVFSFYMLSSSREPAWGDARMFDVASHMVEGELPRRSGGRGHPRDGTASTTASRRSGPRSCTCPVRQS
jgi:hypothetical protein